MKTIDNVKPVILVAEDDEGSRLLLKMFLGHKNCEVIFAKNGYEVLEHYKNNHLDLILMDVKMPGMDGSEATSEIRKIELERNAIIRIPIIGITALFYSGSREMFLNSGMDYVLFKPVDINILSNLIYSLIDLN